MAELEQAPPELDWTPVRPGGAAIRTHRLVRPSPDRLVLIPSVSAWVLGGLFGAMALGSLGLALWGTIAGNGGLAVSGGIMGLTCAGMTVMLWRLLDNRRVFDAGLGQYTSTRKGDAGPLPLADIRGLQIVEESVSGPESSFASYELNLILDDGRRVNVIDQGDFMRLHADARQIARFLNVPLWVAPELQRLVAIATRAR